MKIMITGGTGFLGKALVRELTNHGHLNLTPLSSRDGDLTKREVVDELIERHKPDIIIHLAAHVGGIGANMRKPGQFFFDNITMGVNLIDSAYKHGVDKFVQVGTVCSYPKFTPVPFKETDIWNGFPEETNSPYGIAKKALLTMLHAYRQEYHFNGIYLIPVNLYGPRDNFNLHSSHVIPALITKVANAKLHNLPTVEVWGTGKASREFLYVDDCARAIRLAMQSYDKPEPVNIGSGEEITIKELAEKVVSVIGYNGQIQWNVDAPDGQPRRCLDTSRAAQEFGFRAQTSFSLGLLETVRWYFVESEEWKHANAIAGTRH